MSPAARAREVAVHGALLGVAALFLLPFYLLLRNALMDDRQIVAPAWHWLPHPCAWSNLRGLFSGEGSLATGLANSTEIALLATAGQLLFSSMAGYALARIPARGREAVLGLVVATLMVPATVTFVPTYAVVAGLGGVDTMWGLVAPSLFNGFATFLFRQFYLEFPAEIEEAGRIDGLGYFGIYWHLLLPNSKGIFASLGALAFVGSWNGFLWPLMIGQGEDRWTVQVVLSTFLTSQTVRLGPLFMAAAIAAVPPVLVFFVLQRFIVQGTAASGIKG